MRKNNDVLIANDDSTFFKMFICSRLRREFFSIIIIINIIIISYLWIIFSIHLTYYLFLILWSVILCVILCRFDTMSDNFNTTVWHTTVV